MEAKAYNALNGAELLEIALKKMREAAEQSGHFDLMLTYPVIHSLKAKIWFEAYPIDPPTREVEVEVPVPSQKPDPKKPFKAYQAEGELQGVGSEVAPDEVRSNFGLGVPTPVRESAGIVERLMDAVGKRK